MYLPTRLPEVETETSDPITLTLLRAAQVIRERGWCQGQLFDGERSCAAGAIVSASSQNGKSSGAYAIMELERHIGFRSIGNWNDMPGRTADEVIAALESAALSRATAIRGV